MQINLILQPVVIMLLLTIVMVTWVFFTRVPAMKRLKIHPQRAQNTTDLANLLPQEVVRISNNYNHLFEQPVLFYIICIIIALLNHVDNIHIWSAWIYVAIRIIHSIVQATKDIVLIRFKLFILSWIPLILMIGREALNIF